MICEGLPYSPALACRHAGISHREAAFALRRVQLRQSRSRPLGSTRLLNGSNTSARSQPVRVRSPLQPTQWPAPRSQVTNVARDGRRVGLSAERESTPTPGVRRRSGRPPGGHRRLDTLESGDVMSSELPVGRRCPAAAMCETCEWSCVPGAADRGEGSDPGSHPTPPADGGSDRVCGRGSHRTPRWE